MADQYKVALNADGSADVAVTFDISGTGLPLCLAANNTKFHLDTPETTTDVNGNTVATVAWTEATAIAAVEDQATAQKASWIVAQMSGNE